MTEEEIKQEASEQMMTSLMFHNLPPSFTQEAMAWGSFQQRNMRIKVLTRWVNYRLRKNCALQIEDLTPFSNGVPLARLVESLTGEVIQEINQDPRSFPAKVKNIYACLKFLKDSKNVELPPVRADEIVKGTVNNILELLAALVFHFEIGMCHFDGTHGKQAIYVWCTRQLKEKGNQVLRDFTTSFQSGSIFCTILQNNNASFEVEKFTKNDKLDKLENLEFAFKQAEHKWEIPRFVDPEDFIDEPDELSMLLYLCQWVANIY